MNFSLDFYDSDLAPKSPFVSRKPRSTNSWTIKCSVSTHFIFSSRVISWPSKYERYFSISVSFIKCLSKVVKCSNNSPFHIRGFELKKTHKNNALPAGLHHFAFEWGKLPNKYMGLQMARLEGETSNALFDALKDWNDQLKQVESDLRGPQP